MALDYFWNIVFYCGCRHFLAKTTLYFDQKKMPLTFTILCSELN